MKLISPWNLTGRHVAIGNKEKSAVGKNLSLESENVELSTTNNLIQNERISMLLK
jgi:hypothetical protein